jgi:flagellar basal-body rod protein FlgC
MTDFSTSLSLAASGMEAQAQRLQHVSENIANADTPGYRRKTIGFREAMSTIREIRWRMQPGITKDRTSIW